MIFGGKRKTTTVNTSDQQISEQGISTEAGSLAIGVSNNRAATTINNNVLDSGAIESAFDFVAEGLELITGTVDDFQRSSVDSLDSVTDLAGDGLYAVANLAGDSLDTVADLADDSLDSVGDIVSESFGFVGDFLNDTIGAVTDVFNRSLDNSAVVVESSNDKVLSAKNAESEAITTTVKIMAIVVAVVIIAVSFGGKK